MIQFSVGEFKTFVDFLNLTDSEYVDAFVLKDYFLLVNNSAQIFGALKLPYKADNDEIGKAFRLPRVPSIKLAVPGVIQVDFVEDEVCISVLGNGKDPLWEFSFKKQEVYTGEYKTKMELCETLNEYEAEDLGKVYEIAKLTKAFRTMISVEKGYAVGFINSRVRLLKKVNLKNSFTVNADAFLTLYSFTHQIKKAKNFLAAQLKGLSVLVTLCLPAESMDFDLTEQQKSAMKCDIELRNVIELLNKIDFKDEFITLDFKNNAIFLEKNRVRYKIPLLVFNMQCSPKYELDTLAIPVKIFKLLIAKMGDSFKISKRPTYLRLECKDLILYL